MLIFMNELSLLPCPFCGAKENEEGGEHNYLYVSFEIMEEKGNHKSAAINCSKCGTFFNYGIFGSWFTDEKIKEDVYSLWNVRHKD